MGEFLARNAEALVRSIGVHLFYTLVSVAIGFVLGLGLGILLSRFPRQARFILPLLSLFNTIPGVVFIGLLFLVLHVQPATVLIALSIYAMFPVLKNTFTGLLGVDAQYKEAAQGCGMSPAQQLLRVELPLAMPTIIGGLRMSMVYTVSWAVLAAMIGLGGLGTFIYQGVQSSNNALILLGAVPVSLLALLFDFIFAKLEQAVTSEGLLPNEQIQNLPKRVIRRRQVIAVGVCVALVVVAIGGNLVNKKSDKHLTVGASNFTEVYIVGNIYKELIEAKTDIQVDTTFGLASTSLEMTAMENGDIDMVVDYSGQVYLSVLGLPLNTNTDEVYEILSEKMRDDYNISVSAPLGYNNTYAMSVRPEIAEQYQLETLTDLMAVAPELRLGCTADFTQREDALPRLESTFHTKFGEVNALDVAVRYTAIDSGQVDVIDAFATDALLSKFDLVQLEDDASFFPPYYAVNFIRQECLDEYPELKEVLALLDGRISNEAMAAMNAEVDLEGRNAADVAHDFLVEEGLI